MWWKSSIRAANVSTMGTSTSGSRVPEGITEVNASLWQLYSPAGMHEVDIILFHGLHLDDFKNAFWKTWLAKDDDKVVWPKEWLSKALPQARIMSVSYNSSVNKDPGQIDMDALGENLYEDIVMNRSKKIGQERPVILVGHCLGGIVMKHFILTVIAKRTSVTDQVQLERINKFLGNFKGAFFYATPHGGSDGITRFARQLSDPSPVLRLMRTLAGETQRVNEEFRMQRRNLTVKTYGVREQLPTTTGGFNEVIVVEASDRCDVDGFYFHTEADHFTVCRARDANDSIVIGKLIDFIVSILPEGTITEAQQDELPELI